MLVALIWAAAIVAPAEAAGRFYQGYQGSGGGAYRPVTSADQPGLFFIETTIGGYSRDVEEPVPSAGTTYESRADTTRLLARFGVRPVPILEIYGLAGGADLSLPDFDDFRGDFVGAYGGGARLTFYQSPIYPGLKFYIDGNVLQFESRDTHLVDTIVQEEKIRWTEYTGMVGIRGRYFLTEPYGGIRASWVSARDRIPSVGDLHIRQQDSVGLFAGIDIYLDRSRTVALNIEGTAIDQNSIRGGLRFNF